MNNLFESLNQKLKGDLHRDPVHLAIYSTDASVYKEEPLAVCFPRDKTDLVELVNFANRHHISLIPRTAGTSLAGQVVGKGIIVDFSKYFTGILELNTEEKWVRVQPGVVLDELNQYLKEYGLFFGPETSTANRCMIGGMLGNNACGLHSLVYGSTRDHTLEVECVLSDGSIAKFSEIDNKTFFDKAKGKGLEGEIYSGLYKILSLPANRKSIVKHYPDPSVPRRNTGYALDVLLNTLPFEESGEKFNMVKLIAGSEGTLVMASEIKLNLLPLPPPEKALICAHFNSVNESLKANLVALMNKPSAVELMDSAILECAKSNKAQADNSFFIEGKPRTILIIEQNAGTREELDIRIKETISSIKNAGFGYAFPVVYGSDCAKVWNLRKAGLGLLANIPGDAKSVSVIEDTAVPVNSLPDYIEEVDRLFDKMGMECVYHAHVGSGELHLRPLLNLKDKADVKKFRQIATEIVALVKKYKGSLSGEHGDGRLRAPFIPQILGGANYELIKQVKNLFDPRHILNPGKIVEALPMDEFLRYKPGSDTREIDTIYDFSRDLGIVRSIEKCNGSGDCRKSHLSGGTMCPSYQATKDERNTTRARANVLREFIGRPSGRNDFDHKEIFEILDLCLSCKACKSECPSSVDMAKLKGEFLHNWHKVNGVPLRTKLIGNISGINKAGSLWPSFANLFLANKGLSKILKKNIGIAVERSLPEISKTTPRKWADKNLLKINPGQKHMKGEVCLFIDEFTSFNDAKIGIKAIKLLCHLGYRVLLPPYLDSGRARISKGLLEKARKLAIDNVLVLKDIVDDSTPLIGIEPSAILSFRDEYPDLVGEEYRKEALSLANNAKMIDEFLAEEIDLGNITKDMFTSDHQNIKLHGHCQQKAIASTSPTIKVLSFPENYTAVEIPSGCCGMAGSFGYEKEHYSLSMKIGELVLFPEIRKSPEETIICAYGTSCRHQIKDGTGRKSYHPVEILYDGLSV